MRGADGGRWGRICALPALWVGLLYSDNALDAAWDRVKHWTIEEREALRHAVPREALEAAIPGGGTVRDLAAEVLEIAGTGLRDRIEMNAAGDSESGFLDPLREVVASGKTFADSMLERYQGAWNGDVRHVYDEFSF